MEEMVAIEVVAVAGGILAVLVELAVVEREAPATVTPHIVYPRVSVLLLLAEMAS